MKLISHRAEQKEMREVIIEEAVYHVELFNNNEGEEHENIFLADFPKRVFQRLFGREVFVIRENPALKKDDSYVNWLNQYCATDHSKVIGRAKVYGVVNESDPMKCQILAEITPVSDRRNNEFDCRKALRDACVNDHSAFSLRLRTTKNSAGHLTGAFCIDLFINETEKVNP